MRTLFHRHAGDDAAHGIDLAPMLDFVTNLLIFFIITAVFLKQAGLEINRPKPTDSAVERLSKTIVIDEHGAISIDARTIDPRSVRAHIEQFKAAGANDGIVVAAHEHAPTGALVAVVDEVHLGGIADITFTTTR
jgi:biopolymer transport protein ExbD